MGKSQTNYQKRKWFEIWRSKFLNKNHYNYLCEIQRSLSQKKSSSVSFDLKKGKERVHSLKRLANSAKRASSAHPLEGPDDLLSQFVRADFDTKNFVRNAVRKDTVSDDLAHLRQGIAVLESQLREQVSGLFYWTIFLLT